MAVASDGSVLAHGLPQVHVLPSGIGGSRPVLLHQKRHDSLQDRLQTVSNQLVPVCLRLVFGLNRIPSRGTNRS